MTLKELAEELNKYNQDNDVSHYTVYRWRSVSWIEVHKKDGGDYLITKGDAKELLKSFKEGK